MDRELVPRFLLSNRAFRGDMEALLKLSPEALSAIARLASGPEGFSPSEFAPRLAEEIKVPSDQARQLLRAAEYFYDRVSSERIAVKDAVEELEHLAVSVNLTLSEQHRKVLADVLAYKREYEFGRAARNKVTAKGPHFEDVTGSWSIKILRTREDERVEAPVLALTVTWHDSRGNEKDAFFILNDRDWEDLKKKVDAVGKERQVLDDSLRSRRGEAG